KFVRSDSPQQIPEKTDSNQEQRRLEFFHEPVRRQLNLDTQGPPLALSSKGREGVSEDWEHRNFVATILVGISGEHTETRTIVLEPSSFCRNTQAEVGQSRQRVTPGVPGPHGD